MNPIGIHYGYWTQYWDSEPIQFVKRAQKCGFDVLEVNAPKITLMGDVERDAREGAAADAGLGLTYNSGLKADMTWPRRTPRRGKKASLFFRTWRER